MTRFNQTDISTEPSVAVTTPPNIAITDGVAESTLQIVDTQYPADDGVYVCTGSNTHDGVTTSTSAMITVQVLGRFVCVCKLGYILFIASNNSCSGG